MLSLGDRHAASHSCVCWRVPILEQVKPADGRLLTPIPIFIVVTTHSDRSRVAYALIIGPWILAVPLAVRIAAAPLVPTSFVVINSVTLTIGILIATGIALLIAPSTSQSRRHAVGHAAGLMSPFAALLAVQSSGAYSLAFVAACVCALGVTASAGWRGVMIGAVGLLIVVLAAPAIAGIPPRAGDIAYACALVATVTVLPVLYIARSVQRGTMRTLAELPEFSMSSADEQSALTLTLSGDTRVFLDGDAAETDARINALARYLRQVRDTLGVRDVVYWRSDKTALGLVPAAWASDDGDKWLSSQRSIGADLIGVQSASRVALFDRAGEGAMAAVAVPGQTSASGVLTVHAASLQTTNEVLARWLPRFADNLGLLAQLLDTQAEYSRQTRQSQSLLQASQVFQQHRSIDTLGQAICDAALTVSGASRAALIRWLPESATGVIQCVSSGHHLTRGGAVLSDSLVGELCVDGKPQVWEDAQLLQGGTPIYGAGVNIPRLGSLSIVPLRQGAVVSGAIVVESDTTSAILTKDMRNVRLLSAIAAVSLETVWQIEEATLRARTDALTGLANRRAFDEALARAVAEADRFGHSVGLVICDVDNFKRVNDLYGHEIGDHVLRSIAAILSTNVRGVDMIARYGGEELVMLLGKADVAMAWEVAERMRAAIEAKTIGVGEHLIHVTASFGVAAYPDSAHAGDGLFPAADKALYAAKGEGRNCVRFAKPLQAERPSDAEGTSDGEGWKDSAE
jgi:diguanylate cyclase (GGDEF)-like protein